MKEAMQPPTWWHNPQLDGLDRRTRKTREALYTAMATLLCEKPLNRITVTELTAAADVSRSAFYANFQDIYGLFDSMRQSFRETVVLLVREQSSNLARRNFRPLLHRAYDYFDRNIESFTFVFGSEDNDAFYKEWIDVIRETCLALLCGDLGTQEQGKIKYQIEFIARGSVGMARRWIKDGRHESVDEMVELNSSFIDAVVEA